MASWCKVFLLAVLIHLLHKARADCNSEGKSCDQCYQTLASFLVNTSDNLYQLQRAFFPPKKTPSVFVAVTYIYSSPNVSNETVTYNYSSPNVSNETVTYNYSSPNQIWFWSAGIFYFYQPLRVFQFTSLFFGNPNWRRNNVTLTLPADCANAHDEFMELLTQLLKLYAMWQSAKPRIDNTYVAVAVKLNNLHERLYQDAFLNGNTPNLLYCFQFLFPFLVCLLAVLYICWSCKSIGKYAEKQSRHIKNWATISAYAIMCWTFVAYVIALDIAAVAYRDHNVMPTSEFFTTTEDNLLYQYPLMLLAVWDVFALLSIFLFTTRLILSYNLCCDSPVLPLKDEYKYLVLILFGIAPLLCLASHAHYIAIAWITDPVYSGAIGIYYGILIFMWFFLLKQAYNKNFWLRAVQMSVAWLTIIAFQVLTSFFFVYIPVKHSIENTPSFLYAFISGTGVLLLLLIAYKVIHDPRGTLSVSGTIQNVLHKMKDKKLKLRDVDNWDDLDEEEKFTEFVYSHYDIKGKCTPMNGTNATSNSGGTATSNSGGTATSNSGGTATSNSGGTATSNSGGTATSNSGGTATSNLRSAKKTSPTELDTAVLFGSPV